MGDNSADLDKGVPLPLSQTRNRRR